MGGEVEGRGWAEGTGAAGKTSTNHRALMTQNHVRFVHLFSYPIPHSSTPYPFFRLLLPLLLLLLLLPLGKAYWLLAITDSKATF